MNIEVFSGGIFKKKLFDYYVTNIEQTAAFFPDKDGVLTLNNTLGNSFIVVAKGYKSKEVFNVGNGDLMVNLSPKFDVGISLLIFAGGFLLLKSKLRK